MSQMIHRLTLSITQYQSKKYLENFDIHAQNKSTSGGCCCTFDLPNRNLSTEQLGLESYNELPALFAFIFQ